jgi:hypothetical protein
MISITEQPCKCTCGWTGTVYDCEPDVDGDGSLGCPECEKVIEVVVPGPTISLKRRSLFGRILKLPHLWLKHYRILRRHDSRLESALLAAKLARLILQ